MSSPAPPWLGRTDDLSDTERYAAMTPDERLACFVEVCELAQVMLAERADRREILEHREPMPPAAEEAWLRLVRQGRGDGAVAG